MYKRTNKGQRFPVRWADIYPVLQDRFEAAGGAKGDYFHQDLWAARRIFERHTSKHVDVGSRLDGFVAHLLVFCDVEYVDIRALPGVVPGLCFRQGSILELPFRDQSLDSVSSLHVIEHIGLGRYGDLIDPDGYEKAARELARVVAPGGRLLIGTPVGRERLCFDAHRVFDPETVVQAFSPLQLVEFSLIDDSGLEIRRNAEFSEARRCSYGCGLFLFERVQSP